MKNFRTYDLAVTFYRLIRLLQVTGHLRDQLNRAAQSIVLNLAEGNGRASKKDQRRFFTIALGSLRECQAALQLEKLENTEADKVLDRLGAHLYKLIQNTR